MSDPDRNEALEECARKFATKETEIREVSRELMCALATGEYEEVALQMFRVYAEGWIDGAEAVAWAGQREN